MTAVEQQNPRDLSTPFVLALVGHSVLASSEDDLVQACTRLFNDAGLGFVAEYRLNERDRIDMFAGGLGIEFKIQASIADVLRQLDRYAACPAIRALLFVTTKRRLANLPAMLRDVPLVTVCMGGI